MDIHIDYTNYRGERAIRLVRPIEGGIYVGTTEHHPEPQWLMRAVDVKRDVERTFAMRDIHAFDCSAP
jgi:hypothetical protein